MITNIDANIDTYRIRTYQIKWCSVLQSTILQLTIDTTQCLLMRVLYSDERKAHSAGSKKCAAVELSWEGVTSAPSLPSSIISIIFTTLPFVFEVPFNLKFKLRLRISYHWCSTWILVVLELVFYNFSSPLKSIRSIWQNFKIHPPRQEAAHQQWAFPSSSLVSTFECKAQ